MWYADSTAYFQRHGTEATANATEIYTILQGVYGWCFEAIMAALANIYAESTFNPWLWEGQTVRAKDPNSSLYYRNFTGGYGLVQWTPYPSTPFPNTQPYIDSPNAQAMTGYAPNFSDYPGATSDGLAQTHFLDYDIAASGNWFPCSISYYQADFLAVGVDILQFRTMTVTEFKLGTFASVTPTNMIGAFELNYLRPNAYYAAQRFQNMLDEYDYWYQYFSGQPPVPPTIPVEWMAAFLRKKRKGGFIFR